MKNLKRTISLKISLVAIFFLAIILGACSAKGQGVAVDAPAPGFSLPTAQGGMVSLADFTGKQPVLIFFHMAVG